MSLCWIDGKIMPSHLAQVSVYDHGLLYGDGIFEGIRFYNHKAFFLNKHLQRLQDSANAINLTLPYSLNELENAVNQLIKDYAKADGYMRLVITRGIGALGINPELCKKATAFIIIEQLGFVNKELRTNGAKLIIASTRRLPPSGLDPRIKSLNYLNHIMAKMEATHAGADEAILLNNNGNVTEGTTDNIFIVKNGILYTPLISDGALAGITRRLIIDLAKQRDITVIEKTLAPYDLYTADECFLTGTAIELLAVKSVDGRLIKHCCGKITQELQKHFTLAQ